MIVSCNNWIFFPPNTAVPQARKASLARFLEKRKERSVIKIHVFHLFCSLKLINSLGFRNYVVNSRKDRF